MSSSFIKYDKISIECFILNTKHLTCRISVNGVEGRFLIDSGASNSCIDIESKKKFQLKEFKKSYSASGAGNEKFDAFKTKIAELSYQKTFIEKLNFLLIDMKPINNALKESDDVNIDGILGADFLTKKNAEINYKSMTLSF